MRVAPAMVVLSSVWDFTTPRRLKATKLSVWTARVWRTGNRWVRSLPTPCNVWSSSFPLPPLVSKKLPERLVGMGRISAPFGIKGWIRIQPFVESTSGLNNYSTWWLGAESDWREYKVEQTQVQGT